MTERTAKPAPILVLVLLAFVAGFLGVALGYGQGHFLLSAYHHAGI